MHVNSAESVYRQKAEATKRRKRAAGKYQTERQKRAFIHYLSGGEGSLTKQELDILATHPYLRPSQREYFATLATTK